MSFTTRPPYTHLAPLFYPPARDAVMAGNHLLTGRRTAFRRPSPRQRPGRASVWHEELKYVLLMHVLPRPVNTPKQMVSLHTRGWELRREEVRRRVRILPFFRDVNT
jgi:hypothetical protein